MIEFLQEYWHVLIRIVLLIIVTCVTLFKKKVKVVDTIKEQILAKLPDFVNMVEKNPHDPGTKLDICVSAVNFWLNSIIPDFKIGSYDDFIIKNIENILSTPQKKEVSNGKR